jgi:thiol-disulfide isomerase/thioredoxin
MIKAIILALLLTSQPAANQKAAGDDGLAPAFTLKDARGVARSLADFKGKVVMLNFWATWCVPCQAEMPDLVKWQKENRARGLEIIGVTFPPESRSKVLRMMRRFKLNYRVLFGTTSMTEAYGVGEVLPTTIIIDRDGKLRGRILGIVAPEEFKETVEPLLNDLR